MSEPTPKRRARTPKNAFALPARSADAPPIPEFAPVPRQVYCHDGWSLCLRHSFASDKLRMKRPGNFRVNFE